MNAGRLLSHVTLCLILAVPALAAEELSRMEVLEVLEQLTAEPRTTWISAGTIEATHEQYRAAKVTDPAVIEERVEAAVQGYSDSASKIEKSEALQKRILDALPANTRYKLGNEYHMTTQETVRYDGDRFYWEVGLESRSDSMAYDTTLSDNAAYEHFRQHEEWNRKRVFVWDGQQYTTYSASGNQATVDAAGRLPRAVNGPLTAGLIPWGHGVFTYANLSMADLSGTRNDDGTIEMTIDHVDGSVTELVLDPAREYAVSKAVLTDPGNNQTTYTCSDYKLVGGQWVPMCVTIRRPNGADDWTITSISSDTPSSTAFAAPFDDQAVVAYSSPVTESPAIYTYSVAADTDALLFDKLAHAARQRRQRENCATAALRYVASRYGKTLADKAVCSLVDGNGETSLLSLKEFAQGSGLYCRAVKADLTTLQDLQGATAILHLPGQNHFVIFDRIDEERNVWLVDLEGKRFYYPKKADFFPFDWSDGTALLVSDRPIPGPLTELPDTLLTTLTGGNGYTCTKLLQDSYIVGCTYLNGYCTDTFRYYFKRYGCEAADSGSCFEQAEIRFQESPCVDDLLYDCTITGTWYYFYMRACQ
jgi:hypothetical protein